MPRKEFISGSLMLMASDMGGDRLVPGNSIFLLLDSASEAPQSEYFEKLSADGRTVILPAVQFRSEAVAR